MLITRGIYSFAVSKCSLKWFQKFNLHEIANDFSKLTMIFVCCLIVLRFTPEARFFFFLVVANETRDACEHNWFRPFNWNAVRWIWLFGHCCYCLLKCSNWFCMILGEFVFRLPDPVMEAIQEYQSTHTEKPHVRIQKPQMKPTLSTSVALPRSRVRFVR